MPAFTFDKEEHDFGTLIDGEKVTYSFRLLIREMRHLLFQMQKVVVVVQFLIIQKSPLRQEPPLLLM